MHIELKLKIPEAKTKDELRKLTRDLVEIGKMYSLINYQIIDWKIVEDK